MEVVGIKDGTLGLIQRPVNSIEFNYEIVSGSLFREGGTFLGTTNKGDPFNFKGEDGKYSDVSDKNFHSGGESFKSGIHRLYFTPTATNSNLVFHILAFIPSLISVKNGEYTEIFN